MNFLSRVCFTKGDDDYGRRNVKKQNSDRESNGEIERTLTKTVGEEFVYHSARSKLDF